MASDQESRLLKNSGTKPLFHITQDEMETDVMIIGGGMAGVFAAINAREKGSDVIMAVKGAIGSSGMTPFANTFMVFDETRGHQRDDWIEKFRKSSEYMVNLGYLEMFLDDNKARWEDLISWGAIEVNDFGPVLRNQVLKKGVRTLERVMLTDLLKQDGRIAGAVGFPLEEDKMIVIKAKATVICAGAGGFKPSGCPISSITHDGDAMAYRAGIEIGGKEFVDFHITNTEHPADVWMNWSTHHNGINTDGNSFFRQNADYASSPACPRRGHPDHTQLSYGLSSASGGMAQCQSYRARDYRGVGGRVGYS